ncbi:hypothetical protein [Jannaschia marina]|nr:hypothetical protein [Jannaschia marina]
MADLSEQPIVALTNYEREQRYFARMHAELQRRNRAKWRLRLALLIAGRR